MPHKFIKEMSMGCKEGDLNLPSENCRLKNVTFPPSVQLRHSFRKPRERDIYVQNGKCLRCKDCNNFVRDFSNALSFFFSPLLNLLILYFYYPFCSFMQF